MHPGVAGADVPRAFRLLILCSLLILTTVEAYRFQVVYRRDGPNRSFWFDVPYKDAYEAAVRQPTRPIYLEDGRWGPGYVHAFWYAAVEGRPRSEFANLKPGTRPPPGSVVISTTDNCDQCQPILRAGIFHVYKAL